MRNLDKEYLDINPIYEQQKEYRKTPEGRIAVKRANERMLLRKMKELGDVKCVICKQNKFEVLNIYNGEVLCYNCRYERDEVLELNEICL